MSDLKPCPCCGGKAVITKGYTSTLDTWPQGTFHRVFCGACQLRQLFHASPEAAADAWNRRTQPEATATAQDLSAVTDAELFDLARAHFGVDLPFDAIKRFSAALASSANALSAGDRVDAITDTQRIDFQQANPHMYFNVDKRGKRWRYGHFSNYPQDDYATAREALDAAILQSQKGGSHG